MRAFITIFIVAVLLNYLWELGQAPLYVGLESYNAEVFWHCFIASLGDGIMVLVITVAGRVTLHRRDWYKRPRLSGYLVMLTAGLILAVAVEWVAVDVLDRWAYAGNMPIIPGLRMGIVPIAQMLLLPPVIFRLVVVLRAKR